MSVGPYLIAAALGLLTTPTMLDRLEALEDRVAWLEKDQIDGAGA
jgi:hypothetical protein